MSMEAHKFATSIPISAELAAELPDFGGLLQEALDDAIASMTRPTYGPRREWRWVLEDDSYLDSLTPEALLAEAKRLHELAVAWFDPEHGYYVDTDEDLAHIAHEEWEHAPGHGPGFGLLTPFPTPEEPHQ